MAQYSTKSTDLVRSRPISGGASGAVGPNLIVIADGANPGSDKVSTAGALGFSGVTIDTTDTYGYVGVQASGVAKILVGTGGLAAGNLVASDANGKAVANTPNPAGTAYKQIVGVAQETVAAGGICGVLIQPFLVLN